MQISRALKIAIPTSIYLLFCVFYVSRYPPGFPISSDEKVTGKHTFDEELFKSLSFEYSVHNKKIYSGKGCNGSGKYRGVSVGEFNIFMTILKMNLTLKKQSEGVRFCYMFSFHKQ